MTENVIQGFRLSPQQRHLWSLRGGAAGFPFAAQGVFLIEGLLRKERLRAAVEEAVARHEILRTGFRHLPGMSLPLQVVDGLEPLWDGERDLAGLEPGEQAARVEEWLDRLGREPFDPERDAPLRLALAGLAPDRHLLLAVLPGLCADSATLDNLAREIGDRYHGREGEPPVQYGDLAEWQNEMLEAEEAEAGRRYWERQEWSPRPAALLPGERQAPADATFTPREAGAVLDRGLTEGLETLARSHGADLETLLVAAWQLLIWRLTAGEETTAGVAFAGRQYEETAGALGLFTRFLPVRVPIAADLPFPKLLARVGAVLRQHGEWQDCFVWPAGAAGASFALAFEYERRPQPAAGSPAFRVQSKRVHLQPFALKLACDHAPDGLGLRVQYDAARVEPGAAEALAGRCRVLLESVARRPGAAAGDLEILGEAEREWLVRGLNDTRYDLPAAPLHRLFEAQAARTPDAVAAQSGDAELTYVELDRRAGALARRLLAAGVGPEERVGVFAERSLEILVAILGVLKAGGAYLPLDPLHPRDRVAFVLADARPRAVVVTQTRLASLLPEHGASLLLLDDAAEPFPGADVPLDGLAYVIYTSGSTGRPKGVMVSHRAIANRLLWMQDAFPLDPQDRLLFKTPFTFDASIWELFVPLLSGARLVVARPDGHQDAAYLAAETAAREVTTLQFVPSMLRLFLEQPGLERCTALRRLYSGGEALPAELRARATARLDAALCNLYGPTEAAIDATFRVCRPDEGEGIVPIGAPIANVQVHVLDPALRPVPAEVPGELYIGGVGLARGYFGRPNLTAERFVPDPFGEPGARLYRSGDLARRLPDGALAFLGRADQQVKVRGVRIEPGEIEAVLLDEPGVLQAVVVAREDVPGDPRLAAYLVPRQGHGLDMPELRRRLRDRLPEALVPSSLVVLAALPTTPSGKLDRRALPAPGQETVETEGGRLPRTLTEELLAGLFADVLGVRSVGAEDSFFEIGGHSLTATQLVSRIRLAFDVDLPLRIVFDRPTVAALAESIDAGRRAERGLEPPPLVPVPRDADLPLSFAQQRLWFIDQFEPGTPLYNLPSAASLSGVLDAPALAGALREIVRRHESLRTRFAAAGGRPVQVIAAGLALPMPLVDLQGLPAAVGEEELRRLAAAEARRPFALDRGPLLRSTLVRRGREEHALLLTLHHIVSDGWSTGVLVRELTALYRAFAEGQPSPLPELPIQYADFAHWQRRWLQGEVLEAQLAYWRRQLEGAPVLELPTDWPRPPLQTFRGAFQAVRVPERVAAGLRALASRQGVTLFMAALAGFKTLLHRYSGQGEVVVGCPVANRTRVEVEPLIGFFVNNLVLRTGFAGDPDMRELLGRARDVLLAASIYQDLPFEQLVEAVQPRRDLSRNALFQVVFMLQNAPRQAIDLPGLTLRSLDSQMATAKFDMVFELVETHDGLAGSIDYNRDLFDASTMARLAAHWGSLLESAAARPETPVSELPLLSAAERHQALLEWNDTVGEYPRDLLIQRLFECRAAVAPEAVAVVADGRTVTYGELNRQANRLAHRLRSRGVGPGSFVGLYLPRRAEMVAALLAVLKAGGAYVPFDSHFPPARVRWILESLGVRSLIADSSRLAALGDALAGLPHLEPPVLLDGPEGFEGPFPETDPEPLGDAGDTAYVIFTSGSTGTPKGVMVRHRPVVNLIDWVNRTFEVGPADRVLFVTSLTFDLSVYDIFGLLAVGGSVRVVSENDLREPRRLVELLAGEPVTWWDSAPAMLQQLAPYFPEPAERALRVVFLSGDWIPVTLPDQVRRSFPGARVIALGGATEATVWSNFHPVGEVSPLWSSIPYGRPIQNASYHVLDARLEPCPVGVAGDLYIGGECLSSGYAGEPELTARKYVPDPFSGRPDAVLYRTGDRARYWADGTLEFLGRLDHQVKIRGFRIELGEIEAALAEHPAVRDAAVMAREDVPGQKRLVAYLVAADGASPAGSELRPFLKERLPEYMVPSAFVVLPELPVTANGKLDRRALPAPDAARPDQEVPFVAPRTPAEEEIAAIWGELLGLDRVGAHDDFFELGGHSLLATQVVSRIRTRFGVELALRDVFRSLTLESQAALVEEALIAATGDDQFDELAELLEGMDEAEAEALLAAGAGVTGGEGR